MATTFRKPFKVLKRNLGYWAEGKYFPDENGGTEITIQATIQEPSSGDMNRIETSPWGQRAARYIKIYTDTRLNCVNQWIDGLRQKHPGDIIYFDGSQYLLFGESNFQHLQSNIVSHWRYYACELIEGYEMERVA